MDYGAVLPPSQMVFSFGGSPRPYAPLVKRHKQNLKKLCFCDTLLGGDYVICTRMFEMYEYLLAGPMKDAILVFTKKMHFLDADRNLFK